MKQSLRLQGTLSTHFAYSCTEKVCWRSDWMIEQKCWARYFFFHPTLSKLYNFRAPFETWSAIRNTHELPFAVVPGRVTSHFFCLLLFQFLKKFHLPSLLKLWSGWNAYFLRQLSLCICVLLKRRLILIVWCKNPFRKTGLKQPQCGLRKICLDYIVCIK